MKTSAEVMAEHDARVAAVLERSRVLLGTPAKTAADPGGLEMTHGEAIASRFEKYKSQAALDGRAPLPFVQWSAHDRIINPSAWRMSELEREPGTPEHSRAVRIRTERGQGAVVARTRGESQPSATAELLEVANEVREEYPRATMSEALLASMQANPDLVAKYVEEQGGSWPGGQQPAIPPAQRTTKETPEIPRSASTTQQKAALLTLPGIVGNQSGGAR